MNRWIETQKRQTERLMTLLDIAAKAGYTLVEPPYFIDYDRFREHSSDANAQAWIKMSNPEGRVLVLRPDLTTSVMEKLSDLSGDTPLKVCYHASVFKQENLRLEGTKEFGFEYFNAPQKTGEAAVLELLHSVMHALKLTVIIEWSHAGWLRRLGEASGLSAGEFQTLKRGLEMKDQERLNAWVDTLPHTEPYRALFHEITTLQGPASAVLQRIQTLTSDESLWADIASLMTLIPATQQWILDCTLISEHEYYEGLLFKAYRAQDASAFLRGGRYAVAAQALTAVGFAFTMTALEEDYDV